MIVKADLHIHTSEDKEDSFIKYSAKDIIDEASKNGISVLALTLHKEVFPLEKFKFLRIYAKKKGILLIRGVEAKIEGKHVLIYNVTSEEHSKINTFEDLRELRRKNKNIFVIAPHPFMPKSIITRNCVRERYFENRDLFDALEFQQFYSFFMNPNRKTIKVAKADGKALVANSDLHFKKFFGRQYTIVDVDSSLTEKNFFNAIKNGKVKVVSNTGFFEYLDILVYHTVYAFTKKHFRS